MRGTSYLAIVAMWLIAGCTHEQGARSAPVTLKRQLAGIVTIVSYDPDKAMPKLGTGFVLAPDRVVTARHVLSGVDRAEVRTTDGQTIAIEGILAENPAMDVVMVKLCRRVTGVPPMPVASSRSEVGERLIACGSPLGLEWTVSDGMVSAIRDIPEAGIAIQHSVPVSPGSSGGPLINSAGEVVAIQTSCITTSADHLVQAGQNLNFGVPAEYILALKVGPLKPLEAARKEVAAGWVPTVTRNVDRVSLRPLTRDDFRSSLAFFERRTVEAPEEADAWFRLGICRERLGYSEEAAEAYNTAVGLRPGFGLAWNNLGAVYNKLERYPEAVEAMKHSVAVRPRADAWNSLAHAYIKLKRYSEAIPAATEAVKLEAKHVSALYNLGLAYLRMGDREKALEQQALLAKVDKGKAEDLKAMIDKK